MGMTADDGAKASRSRIEVKFVDVMKHVQPDCPNLDHLRLRQDTRPFVLVIVAPYSNHWSDGSQDLKHVRRADVPCMDDHIGAFEGFNGCRA